jgi:hypothetical protein
MPFVLSQPITSAYCLSCKGCCRFQEEHSAWRPKAYDGEEEFSGGKVFSKEDVDAKGYVKARSVDGQYVCRYLDIDTNKCQIYSARPFECQLYPFLFFKKQQVIFLAVHLACPFVQEEKETEAFKGYCRDLAAFLTQEKAKEFLKRSSVSISSSHILKDEIEIIAPLLSL